MPTNEINLKTIVRSDLRYTLGRMRRGTENASDMPQELTKLIEPLRLMIKNAGLRLVDQGLRQNGGLWDLGIDEPEEMMAAKEFMTATDYQWYLWGISRDCPVVFPNVSKTEGLELLRKSGTRENGNLLGIVTTGGHIDFTLEDCKIIASNANTRRFWI
jgi:hypothetical protein